MSIEPKVGQYYIGKGETSLPRKVLRIIDENIVYVDQTNAGMCHQETFSDWAKEETSTPQNKELIEKMEAEFLAEIGSSWTS